MKQLQHKHTLHLQDNTLQVRIARNFDRQRYRWVTSRHCNAEYELHILLKGRIPVEVEDHHLFLEARQGILILPGQYHAPLESNGELEHFSLSFTISGGDLADTLHKDISDFLIFSVSTDMLQECRALYHEYSICHAYRNEKIQALLSSLLISVLRKLNVNPAIPASRSNAELERADIIDEFFSEQLTDPHGANQLAGQLHLSERQLNRVLYQLYGMTFQAKMIQSKMDRASWLLRTTDKKISEIAEAIGYSSEAAFYQAFRNYFQTTPKKYRAQKR